MGNISINGSYWNEDYWDTLCQRNKLASGHYCSVRMFQQSFYTAVDNVLALQNPSNWEIHNCAAVLFLVEICCSITATAHNAVESPQCPYLGGSRKLRFCLLCPQASWKLVCDWEQCNRNLKTRYSEVTPNISLWLYVSVNDKLRNFLRSDYIPKQGSEGLYTYGGNAKWQYAWCAGVAKN